MQTQRIQTAMQHLNSLPLFIGSDRLAKQFSKIENNISSYPPYNIVKVDDLRYRIEIAAAGFDNDEISIELKDSILAVSSNISEQSNEAEIDYVHKGIATRSFIRKFTLADTVEVQGAKLEKGILSIDLVNRIPEEKLPRKIEIS